MGKTYNPSTIMHHLPKPVSVWVQSVHKALNGGVDMGKGTGIAPAGTGVNAGVFTQFEPGNGSGVLFRIDASGSSGTGALYTWNSTGVVIQHTLGRQPIGFKVVDKDKACDVYRSAAPDDTQITLKCTDNTASVTVYVF